MRRRQPWEDLGQGHPRQRGHNTDWEVGKGSAHSRNQNGGGCQRGERGLGTPSCRALWILLRAVSDLQCDPRLFPTRHHEGLEEKEAPRDASCPRGHWPCLSGSRRLSWGGEMFVDGRS